ncbi:MAG: hypothetical protein ACXW18_13900, partial [Pyrinomonadaceae bacterium]
WSSKEISMSLEPDDPSDGPILNNIKIGARVFLGYEFEVAQCRLNDRTQISEGALRQWDISFQIEEFNFSPTLEINFAGVSANELAEKRARRILLNEDPATETRDINKSLIEHYTAGQGTVSIKRSMLPELFRQYGDNPQRFLAIAWTCAIALLKLSGAIAEILHLEFALEDESLKVAFHGKRKKEYVNQPPFEIRVTGKCSLK